MLLEAEAKATEILSTDRAAVERLIDRLEAVNAQSIEQAATVRRTFEKLVKDQDQVKRQMEVLVREGKVIAASLEKSRRFIAILMIAAVAGGVAAALCAGRAYF